MFMCHDLDISALMLEDILQCIMKEMLQDFIEHYHAQLIYKVIMYLLKYTVAIIT